MRALLSILKLVPPDLGALLDEKMDPEDTARWRDDDDEETCCVDGIGLERLLFLSWAPGLSGSKGFSCASASVS